ncbi:CoA transferase subunit A [Lacisediminimonas sp.]|uniref:CoA transferase subunit A n=1 Tax=Lacisediminimonas sp. TaxID=3060582 RepID=UPI00272589AB|nr:CoA transferase [Lacisediminimonas sp.]MDO8301307.1 CoA transferase [Lacisediminimonas sp.]
MSSGFAGNDKQLTLKALVARIPDGASLALGGSFLHRGPFAVVRELIRQKKTGLEIIKQSPGYDIDILCRAGAVRKVRAGIVAMEGNFGLAPWYRKAIEKGEAQLEEHACASLTAGLRAAAFGVPFQPCGGLHGSDLPALNGWKCLDDPYGQGDPVYVIPAITPDFAVIHASAIDQLGNVWVAGTSHWDRIMSRAAKSVLVLAEELVDTEKFKASPEATLVPHFMVEAFTIMPGGAWPGSAWPRYKIDYPAVESYLLPGDEALENHMAAAPELKEATYG